MSQVQTDKKIQTYGDYLTWPEGQSWELIEGTPYDMTVAPQRRHQEVVRNLFRQIDGFFADKPCETYFAPFEVRLPLAGEEDRDVITVVQPDILVVCDLDKLDERGCRSAPDFIAEIISPATAAKDQITKTALYEKHGVMEYWVVDPVHWVVMVRLLDNNGVYKPVTVYDGRSDEPVSDKVLPRTPGRSEGGFQRS